MEDIQGIDGLVLGSELIIMKLCLHLRYLLTRQKKIDLKGKVGAAFCSYGWSPEVVDLITNRLKGFGWRPLTASYS